MTRLHRSAMLLFALTLVAVACGDDDADISATTRAAATSAPATSGAPAETTTPGATAVTTAAPTTTAAPATTAAPTTTGAPQPPASTSDSGEVTINWNTAGGIFFIPPSSSSSDPFYFVHNTPSIDGFYLGIEAYTTGYGTAWTGELGMFVIDCSPPGTGICLHYDPDGDGPVGDLGGDFLATGDIEVVQADADGFVAILSNVAFTDGTTIPGPVTISG